MYITNCILVVTVVGKRVKHALASPPTVGQWASCGFSCYYLCFIIHYLFIPLMSIQHCILLSLTLV